MEGSVPLFGNGSDADRDGISCGEGNGVFCDEQAGRGEENVRCDRRRTWKDR